MKKQTAETMFAIGLLSTIVDLFIGNVFALIITVPVTLIGFYYMNK